MYPEDDPRKFSSVGEQAGELALGFAALEETDARDERARRRNWWATHYGLPALVLGTAAIGLARSAFDRSSVESFFETESQSFPLRHGWFFQFVLHELGKYFVILVGTVLVVGAILGWRKPAWRLRSRAFVYLVTCFLATVGIAGLWKAMADQVEPWNTIGFGGTKPWPVPDLDVSFMSFLGSPGAHAASGFAWVSLYFVGAAANSRARWLWLMPGLLLGFLFALGQHGRGAHPPSHEIWSMFIAWSVACGCAWLFRRMGWLPWKEVEDQGRVRPLEREVAIPWLLGVSMGFLGMSFFALDQTQEELGRRFPALHHNFEYVELAAMAVGFGVVAWLLAEKFLSLRAREARRVEAEREQRFQVLGRMAASVAHEVRNPLHTLRLIADLQRREVPGLSAHPLVPEFEASLVRIDRAVELVYRLARPEAVEIERVDLARAARDSIVTLTRTYGDRARFTWEAEPEPAFIVASISALRIVLDNLLRNAIEGSPDDRPIRLRLQIGAENCQLHIVNAGEFAPSQASGEDNLGLGLSISRKIAGNAGGAIRLEEVDGHVACMLTWPRAP